MDVADELVRSLLAAGTAVLRAEAERAGDRLDVAGGELAVALARLQSLAQHGSSDAGTPVRRPATMNTKPVTGIREAAARLGCSESYARRLARAGRLPARRLDGKHWVIEIGDQAA